MCSECYCDNDDGTAIGSDGPEEPMFGPCPRCGGITRFVGYGREQEDHSMNVYFVCCMCELHLDATIDCRD